MDEESRSEAEVRFRQIYQSHYGAVSAYARRRCRDVDVAQDAVSETFLVAWRRLDDVPTGSDSLPWLYGVARRVIANQRRGTQRRVDLSSRLARESVPVPEVDTGVISEDERREVLTALGRLRDSDQEILRLSAWEELSHREIALVVGCSEATVAVRLHRARNRLGKEIARAVDRETSRTIDREMEKGLPGSGHVSRSKSKPSKAHGKEPRDG